MVSERTVTRAGDRRREAAGFFYFRRLRQRRAPLVSSTRCRSPFTPQPHKKPPVPREANRGDARQGLAMLESLVDAAFSADTRLGTFLRSIASKETAAWDAVPGKLGVFPCAPPTFPTPTTTARPARRAPWRVRMRTVEQQLTGLTWHSILAAKRGACVHKHLAADDLEDREAVLDRGFHIAAAHGQIAVIEATH